jgi:plasmid replication initiation protein
MAHLTVLQRTNLDGFPKAGELIDITGAHALEASDRAILNLLYQHAHDSGRISQKDAEWEISLGRLRPSRHESNDRIANCLDRLLKVVVNVPHMTTDGEPRVLKTHLIDFVDLSADESNPRATVRFGVPKKLQPILAESNRWGRIKAEVVCAMTSKYAMALYEMVQLRANLDRCIETFPITRFRDLLGVPPGAYERGNDFMRFVVDPAILEVNGLSDVGVQIDVKRRHTRAPIDSVTTAWWKKQGDEFRSAMRERDQSKLGRMARLRGKVETARPMAD